MMDICLSRHEIIVHARNNLCRDWHAWINALECALLTKVRSTDTGVKTTWMLSPFRRPLVSRLPGMETGKCRRCPATSHQLQDPHLKWHGVGQSLQPVSRTSHGPLLGRIEQTFPQ